MTYKPATKKLKSIKEARNWLIESLRTHLLPVLIRQGFAVAPVVHRGAVDRESVLQLPLGRLLRASAAGVDIVQIELAPYRRAAFRITAGVAPREGVMTPTGHLAAEELYADGLDVFFQMTPGGKATSYFSVRHWPWQTPASADYDQLVLRVVAFVPELDMALHEDRLGPHMRRAVIPRPVLHSAVPSASQQ